jgi:hypothetical protein
MLDAELEGAINAANANDDIQLLLEIFSSEDYVTEEAEYGRNGPLVAILRKGAASANLQRLAADVIEGKLRRRRKRAADLSVTFAATDARRIRQLWLDFYGTRDPGRADRLAARRWELYETKRDPISDMRNRRQSERDPRRPHRKKSTR